MDLKQHFAKYKDGGGSYRKLASTLGLSHAYVQMAINGWGDYNLSDESKRAVEKKVANFFSSSQLEISSKYDEICTRAGIAAFENTINIIKNVIKAVKQGALMGIITKSGSGKTTAFKALRLSMPQMVIVTAYDGMSKKELLEDLADAIGAEPISKSQQNLMKAIKRTLAQSKRVVVIDEANFASTKSIEQIRHIQDETHAPIVLAGTEALATQIARSHEQVVSRIRTPREKLKPFGENEVIMLFELRNIDLSEKEASDIWKKYKNLREVEHMLDDLVEIYKGDKTKLKELL